MGRRQAGRGNLSLRKGWRKVNVDIELLTREQWRPLSENAHLICFSESKPVEMDRIDFALLVKRGSQLLGYCTCRETDSKTLYWQYGGAFPGAKGTSLSLPGYIGLVWWTKQRYDRVSTFIENNNLVMLKMAMKVGFRIIGIKTFDGRILVEHGMEFSK